MRFALLFCVVVTVRCSNDSDYNDISKGPLVTHKVWFDMKIGDVDAGRIVFGLFGRTVRDTVANFVDLARPRPYAGHKFGVIDNIDKGSEMGGGNKDCDSDYGENFEKENFKLKHYGAGWVAMVPMNKETSRACLFYIALKPMPDADGRNVVFAKIISGMKVVNKIANVKVNKYSHPMQKVLIADCGTEFADPPFKVARIAATD